MNLLKRAVGLFVLAAALFSLVGCQIEIPNTKAHVILPTGKVYFKYLNTPTEGIISREAWSAIRVGMICHTPDDFGRMLKFIDKACEKHQDCVINRIELDFKPIYLVKN